MGFPIRRFTDQSLFAAPRDLSQRTTSFIASQRQGIHQTPLWHLIALIAKARGQTTPEQRTERQERHDLLSFCYPSSVVQSRQRFEKTSFASNASGSSSGQAPNPRLVAWRTKRRRDHGEDRQQNCSPPPIFPSAHVRQPDALPLHNVRYRFGRRAREDQTSPRPAHRPSLANKDTGSKSAGFAAKLILHRIFRGSDDPLSPGPL